MTPSELAKVAQRATDERLPALTVEAYEQMQAIMLKAAQEGIYKVRWDEFWEVVRGGGVRKDAFWAAVKRLEAEGFSVTADGHMNIFSIGWYKARPK